MGKSLTKKETAAEAKADGLVKPEAAKVEAEAKAEPEAKPGAAKAEGKKQGDDMELYMERLNRHVDELRWLYMELYDNGSMFAELCENMRSFYRARNEELKALDRSREQEPGWYKKNDMLGMMFYIDNFAGNMKGVEEKLDYLERCNVNYIHLMPFLETPKGRSDGGYAVSDFRRVQENLGSMEDLESLTAACHKSKINVCMDLDRKSVV